MQTPTIEVIATNIENMREDIKEIKDGVGKFITKVETGYVTNKQFDAEFGPVRNLVYGLVALILTIVISAVVYIAMQHGGTP